MAGAVNQGHAHPRVLKAVKQQLEKGKYVYMHARCGYSQDTP